MIFMSSRFSSGLSAMAGLLLGYDSAAICSGLFLTWNFIGFLLLRASLRSGQAARASLFNREINDPPPLIRDRMSFGQGLERIIGANSRRGRVFLTAADPSNGRRKD
jgi:hypothetical protein